MKKIALMLFFAGCGLGPPVWSEYNPPNRPTNNSDLPKVVYEKVVPATSYETADASVCALDMSTAPDLAEPGDDEGDKDGDKDEGPKCKKSCAVIR